MAEENKEEGAKSVTDIAATLLKTPQTTLDPDKESDDYEEEAPKPVEDGADDEDESPSRGVDEDEESSEEEEADELEDEGDESDREEEDEDSDEDDDETDYLDIRDDDRITVMVDDEEQEVTIGDLKKAYSGEGAIEKRLQEATELRKSAHAEKTQTLERLANDQRLIETALDGMDDSLFKEVIPPPPPELRQSDPNRYLAHKEAYEQDQERIAGARKALQGKVEELKEARAKRLQEYAQQSGKILAQEMPELVNPKTSQPMFQRLAATAKSYGYTDAEINQALDPRMFLLVRDAMKFRELSSKSKERDPKDLKGQERKKVRRLRSGNTKHKTRVRQQDQRRKQIREKAQKTGKVEDVAATLLTPNAKR